MKFAIASAQHNCRGETVCGDAVFIETDEDADVTHIAVVDGLGHGPAAQLAAQAFVTYFRDNIAPEKVLVDILHGASKAIERTRGVAASVIRLDGKSSRIQYAGVGNVELIAIGAAAIRPISKPGIVGRRPGRIMLFEYDLHSGDVLTVFTDGISSRFDLETYRELDPPVLCQELLSQWGKNHDDATIVAIRCH